MAVRFINRVVVEMVDWDRKVVGGVEQRGVCVCSSLELVSRYRRSLPFSVSSQSCNAYMRGREEGTYPDSTLNRIRRRSSERRAHETEQRTHCAELANHLAVRPKIIPPLPPLLLRLNERQ
jgi:hypothetical protein